MGLTMIQERCQQKEKNQGFVIYNLSMMYRVSQIGFFLQSSIPDTFSP